MEALHIWSEHFRSFIPLFPSSKQLSLCRHEQYTLLLAQLLISAHFSVLCNMCLFVTFLTSFCVSGGNIILLYSVWLQRPPLQIKEKTTINLLDFVSKSHLLIYIKHITFLLNFCFNFSFCLFLHKDLSYTISPCVYLSYRILFL